MDADGSGTLAVAADSKPAQFDTVSRAQDDLAALLDTSGTTGRSKGAMLTHDNPVPNTRALIERWQITSTDTLIHALPSFHIHRLFVALKPSILAGARVKFMSSFSIDAILKAIPKATMLMGVPTFHTRLLSEKRLTQHLTAGMRLTLRS